jgi:multiple sugar transport system ATP-binding protein
MAEVKLDHIVKRYKTVEVIKDFNMTIADGEFVTLVGPSGCGKSTLLRSIAGLEEISEGKLYIGGKLANDMPAKDRGIAMVFQSYALFPHMTVEANIAFGLKIKNASEQVKREKIDWAVKLLHLEGLEQRYPKELSGGQRQRVAIGRSLVLDPEVLLLDEPLSNLDAKLRLRMRTEFKQLHKNIGHTTIYVTHDQVEAMTLSDRIAIMYQGVAQQIGSPFEVFNHPSNMFVAGFIGSPPINFLEVDLVQKNGTFMLTAEDFQLSLDSLEQEKLQTVKNSGLTRLVIGIRPQDIYTKGDYMVEGITGNLIPTKVDVTEPLGESVIIVVSIGSHIIKATLPNEVGAQYEMDAPIELAINTKKIHLFDPNTEKALF